MALPVPHHPGSRVATECWLDLFEKQHQAICDYAGCEVVELNVQRDDCDDSA